MFCPNCGKGDQQPAGYCRQCGTLQPDPLQPFYFPHLSRTSARTNTVLNAVASLTSLAVALVLYAVVLGIGGGALVHVLAWASILVGLWCAFASWRSFQLESDFDSGPNGRWDPRPSLRSGSTDKLLEEPNFEEFIPPSVTDSTTNRLGVAQNRSSKS